MLDEDDQEEEEEVSGRRHLIVPKIYIKKPPVNKEVERPKLHADRGISEDAKDSISKRVEQPLKSNVEQSEPKEKIVSEKQDENKKLENLSIVPEQSLEQATDQKSESKKEEEKRREVINIPLEKNSTEKDLEEEVEDDEDGNPIEKINKNLEEMDSDEMEKMMEEEEFANKQLQLVALQLEKEKKRKAEEAKRFEIEPITIIPAVPAKRGRKPKSKEVLEMPKALVHEPIVSNVKALIRNDNDNDELSEPPGVALPLFEELASRKVEEETPKKNRSRGNYFFFFYMLIYSSQLF